MTLADGSQAPSKGKTPWSYCPFELHNGEDDGGDDDDVDNDDDDADDDDDDDVDDVAADVFTITFDGQRQNGRQPDDLKNKKRIKKMHPCVFLSQFLIFSWDHA